MKWTALLMLVLILCPTTVTVCITLNTHFAKPVNTITFEESAKPSVLLDPVGGDGPGAIV